MAKQSFKGSCLCGGVAYEINGPLRQFVACHCRQCRKTTGHFMVATGARHADFGLTSEETLKWYRASDFAKRGFCGACGSTLFWQHDERDQVAIAAGTLDGPTGHTLKGHIFCADKGDYYAIEGGEFHCDGTYGPPPEFD